MASVVTRRPPPKPHPGAHHLGGVNDALRDKVAELAGLGITACVFAPKVAVILKGLGIKGRGGHRGGRDQFRPSRSSNR
jgi:hypothetical protein